MLLLLPASLVLIVQILPVLIDLAVEVVHDRLIELFSIHDVVFMALEGLSPRGVLGWIVVLNHSIILLRHDITAIIQRLDLVWCRWHVPRQSVLAKIDVAFKFRAKQIVRGHSSATRETATCRLVEATLSAAAPDHSLTLRDQIVLQIGSHLPSQTLSVLVEHLSTHEREVVELVPVVFLSFSISPVLVIELLLSVEEEKFVLEHIISPLLGVSLVLVALLHSPNIVVILLKLEISFLLLFDQVLAHFPQVVL